MGFAAFALACSKKAALEDPYAAPSSIALAPASADAPHYSTRLLLSPVDLKRDAATLATIAELREAIHDVTLQSRLATAIGSPADVLLYVDRATPFEVLTSLVMLLGVSGVRSDHIELAVAGADGRTSALRLGPPHASECELTFRNLNNADAGKKPSANDIPCTSEPGLAAAVRIDSEGFAVMATGANLATNCDDIGPGMAVRGHDLVQLGACLDRIKHLHKEFETERSIVISAAPATRFEDVAPVLASVRRALGGTELFPDVTLAPPK